MVHYLYIPKCVLQEAFRINVIGPGTTHLVIDIRTPNLSIYYRLIKYKVKIFFIEDLRCHGVMVSMISFKAKGCEVKPH